MYPIVRKETIAPDTYLIEVKAPEIARKARAGQFVVLRINDEGERIPLTIADFNRQTGTLVLVFQAVGKTTRLLAAFSAGGFLLNLAGPMGKPTEIEKFGTVVCVAGGIGAAPIYPIARELKKAGNRIFTVLGARCDDLLIYEEELRDLSEQFHLMTDDGSKGRCGLVTDALKDILDAQRVDRVIAIGPAVMMKFVAKLTEGYRIPTIVSLNPIMVDGTGMCGSCRVEVGGMTRFCCVHGPEFDAHQVDFDLLISRQRMYLEEEKIALEKYETSKKQEARQKARRK